MEIREDKRIIPLIFKESYFWKGKTQLVMSIYLLFWLSYKFNPEASPTLTVVKFILMINNEIRKLSWVNSEAVL